ncbi:MAG TPA: thioredoxin domain-containing protein, partial [Aggregatilineales bacterium]|nr:thioredoxin domain-containing protein [Aggregatilineales bacterium]
APIPEGTETRYAGIPQTYSIENGMPMLGSPNAPVQVVSYTSFACPSCKDFHSAMTDTMIDLIKQGIMSYTIIPQENGEIPNGNGAARGALCAAEQGKFFEFGDILFSWQETFANQAFGQNRMFAGADALGLDGCAFRGCIASGKIQDLYNRAQDLRLQRGITGTPRTYINGIEYTGGLTDRNAFNSAVQQSYQGTGRIAVPLATETPETNTVPETTPVVESTPEVTPVIEATPEITAEATTEVVVPEVTEETTAEATPSN